MTKVIEYQYTYKKKIGFTQQQRKTFETLKEHKVNINQFIRQAVKEKLKRDWKQVKELHNYDGCPW